VIKVSLVAKISDLDYKLFMIQIYLPPWDVLLICPSREMDQQIVKLAVAMDHFFRVQIIEAAYYLEENFFSLLLRQATSHLLQ
jgi:hypothetical protein